MSSVTRLIHVFAWLWLAGWLLIALESGFVPAAVGICGFIACWLIALARESAALRPKPNALLGVVHPRSSDDNDKTGD